MALQTNFAFWVHQYYFVRLPIIQKINLNECLSVCFYPGKIYKFYILYLKIWHRY